METKKIAETWLLPLKELDGCSLKIKDSEGHQCFDYFGYYPLKDLLEILNGYRDPEPILEEYEVKGPDIIVNGRLWMRIRGWGYLTGHGNYALGLMPQEAVARQDELREWILKKIS
jgi:hypothetical protein